jgi:hypothetical protein
MIQNWGIARSGNGSAPDCQIAGFPCISRASGRSRRTIRDGGISWDASTITAGDQGNFGCPLSTFGIVIRNLQRGKGFDNFGACVLEGRDGH